MVQKYKKKTSQKYAYKLFYIWTGISIIFILLWLILGKITSEKQFLFIFILLLFSGLIIIHVILPIIGIPCPSCKKWRAGEVQSSHSTDNKGIKMITAHYDYQCKYCANKWNEVECYDYNVIP